MKSLLQLENERAKREAPPGSILVRDVVNSEHALPLPVKFSMFSFYGVLRVGESCLECVHIRSQSIGPQRTEAIGNPPLGHVNITAVIPSNQCTTARGDPVTFREAIVSPEHRARCIIHHVPFDDLFDPFSKWSQWDEKSAFSNQVFSSLHPLVDDSTTDRAMLQAMHPQATSCYPEPPPPIPPPPSDDPEQEKHRQVILAQTAEFERRYDLEWYRFWYDQWHQLARAGRLQSHQDWEQGRHRLFHVFTNGEFLSTTRELHAANKLRCHHVIERILDLVRVLRDKSSASQRDRVFNLKHVRASS